MEPTAVLVGHLPPCISRARLHAVMRATRLPVAAANVFRRLIGGQRWGVVCFATAAAAAEAVRIHSGTLRCPPSRDPLLLILPTSLPPTEPTVDPQVFVSGLPVACRAATLYRNFSQFGRVVEVRVQEGRALVLFADMDASEKAIETFRTAPLLDYQSVLVRYSDGDRDLRRVEHGECFCPSKSEDDGASDASRPDKSRCTSASADVEEEVGRPKKRSRTSAVPPLDPGAGASPRDLGAERLRRESAEMQRLIDRWESRYAARAQKADELAQGSSSSRPAVKPEPVEPPDCSADDGVGGDPGLAKSPAASIFAAPAVAPLAGRSTAQVSQWLARELPFLEPMRLTASCERYQIDGCVLAIASHTATEGSVREWDALFQALLPSTTKAEHQQQLLATVASAQPLVPPGFFSSDLPARLCWPEQRVKEWFQTLGLSKDYGALLAQFGFDGNSLFGVQKHRGFLHRVLKESLQLPLGDAIKVMFAIGHTRPPG
eukprot:EG_transcript_7151